MKSESCELVDAGVDWYTGTCNDEKLRKIFLERCALNFISESGRGNDKANWSAFGYEGFSCGGIRFGERQDGAIAILSGPNAQQNWKRFYKLGTNTSRIDLQVTLRWPMESHTKLAQHFKAAQRYHRSGKARRRVTLLKSTDRSATIYLGSRASDVFGRIYQKDAESGLDHYLNAIRYEIEFKGEAAGCVAKILSKPRSKDGAAISHVYGQLRASGIVLPTLEDVHNALICVSRTRSDLYGRLEWIKVQVRPSVESALAHGKLELLIEALGLSDYVQPVGAFMAHSSTSCKEDPDVNLPRSLRSNDSIN